jgi:C1A family cysteine protease
MRNPRVPYKSTGFMARPSKSMLAGASRLPMRTVMSTTKMPANFCYTAADVTAVRDQGSCGSCWAVSATSMMADRAYVASQGKIRCALSAQQLMECSDYSDGGTPVGCEGNDPFTALKTIKEHPVYVIEEREYPRQYTATPSSASNCLPGTDVKSYAVSASEAFMLTDQIPSNASDSEKAAIIKNNVENMKQSLYNEGPLVVVFAVPDDLKDYDGLSIYDAPENFNAEQSNSWHAVELIGWRTEPSTQQQYWVCRNSWGPQWPANHRPGAGMGEFYMSLGKNTCAIEQYAVGIVPKLVNTSKARNTPDNTFPGESGYGMMKFDAKMGAWASWIKVVAAVAVIGGGIYAYKKYYMKK